ncbi:molybdopterin-synthase adenylyltransferase MoeB [Paracoccus sp. DMF-8]|uniref:HesA/MoeB/ThiF family protein n=1 Tax=Paracoccus sp. DMF-8 TaxID=3019445 RepID=UPI0023E41153|nr:molybdopterin-synthase adenylyltransferase MoeB [Paracoccus sp. DMF-8]MDF3607342.1 molybdopterin-synthase adenylyltransferase MoeB [Paracoccus sp. DMF-8]
MAGRGLGAALMPGGALGDMRHWLILGVIAALVMGYRGVLSRLSRRAVSGPAPGMVGAVAVPEPVGNAISDDELDRYARHIVLREIGGPGQQKLRNARVLIVGAGALGAPVALYLAAAGVGRITIADDDRVSLSNLQRQVIYGGGDIGQPKVHAAARRLADLNPHVQVTPLPRRITADDVALIRGFDLVLDGTDSFRSRQAVNRACTGAGVALVGGSIAQWEGQLSVWDPVHDAPCTACIFPDEPAPGLAPSCAEAGVVGALPGVIGSLMALEAIKLITGAGSVARGRLLILDGLWGETRSIAIRRNPDCPVCGSRG